MTQKLHRKELKHDEIGVKFGEAVKGLTLHGKEVIWIATVVVSVLVIVLSWSYYEKRQTTQSQALLGTAMDKFNAKVGAAAAADPTAPKPEYTYNTEAEKYGAALADFDQVIRKYGQTSAAQAARYYAGVCAFYLKEYPRAEGYLKESGQVSDRNVLFFLSRMSLAELYNLTGKSEQGIPLLQEAMDKNQNLVAPETLLLALADTYKKAGKTKEATDTYQKIVNQYKDSPLSYKAQTFLTEMKK
jgi:tetratricopeptide (TPR) repeat protein